MLAGFIGGWELVLILAVILILFGAKRLPELARGLGQGIKEFKKASSDVTNELQRALEDEPPPPPPRRSPPPHTQASSNESEPAAKSNA